MAEYDDDVSVDRNNLHIELEQNSQLIMKWRKEYAQARADRELLKEQLPILKAEAKAQFEIEVAEIESDLRDNWSDRFDIKLTEKALATELVLTIGYKEAWQKYVEKIEKLTGDNANAIEQKEVMYGACRAIEGKQDILKQLAGLYLSGYYGDDGERIIAKLEEQTNMKTRKQLKRKLNRKKDD